jgi:hypothetical protein
MEFRTKLDFSTNRQVKQYPETLTTLSGGTVFGVPFNSLVSGPDLNTSGLTSTISGITSIFSANSGTTIYTSWGDSRMQLGSSYLSAITLSNSAVTQNTSIIFTSSTSTIIDGNIVNLTYTGISFDITPVTMVSIGGGNYSGTSYSQNVNFYSAGTLDFTGRTIWVDVSGITRSNVVLADKFQLTNLNTAPSSSGATGTIGQIRITSDSIYVCVGTNTWKKSSLSSF